MSLGKNIKFYRKQKKMTQSELAQKSYMSRTYLSDIERGRQNPSLNTLNSIAKVLNIDIKLLFNEDYHTEIQEKSIGTLTPKDEASCINATEFDQLPSKPYYTLTKKDEKDIAERLQQMMDDLESNSSLAFMGEPMNEEDRELLRISLENTLRMSKQMAKKKFTPKKYRK
ncbi:hypothetical protein B7C51_08575 [Paenibacillus larvae subsp. pulvifaciens]|uniref:HTH cro/C1-type domain-containing protein n=1 Tax=Paenibacillus larvae subsp. pulvifaciens TaxID=1477 RepID=A0A1V0URT2_9BACL|nr:XRE family transcriptional regulator [Paenibacillus larvae]ARF67874.1 hypothetical protein B7C51_08575 [Paenibacillus larvae subsp. pulvifaciens]